MRKCKTGDTCPGCSSEGMLFYVSRRIASPDGLGVKEIGLLSCPVCGAESWAISDTMPRYYAPCGGTCENTGDACQFCPSNEGE